jgi:predicted helicase
MKREEIEQLRQVKTLPSLIKYLRDELDWPISPEAVEDDVTFTYSAEELGLEPEYENIVKEIKQIRPFDSKQPWGIFWINFDKKRLPVVILRRILGHLGVKRRGGKKSAKQASWDKHDLLFISAYGEDHDRAVTFAHFSQNPASQDDLPALKVLGWDDSDTIPHLADAHETLKEKLRWPSDPGDVETWRKEWSSAFVLGHREVIDTTEKLVEELARLAQAIYKRAYTAIKKEAAKGPLRRLLAAFKESLIHDLDEKSFADVIAQTISYGLLTARFSCEEDITVQNLVEMVPKTNPFLRELLGTFLHIAGRRHLFDFDELGIQDVVDLLNHANIKAVKNDFGNRARGEDPVIHFYEHFLSAYNKEQKIQRGVFYTPQPVVSYIVRSVHDLLQIEFGLEDGLASTVTWADMIRKNLGLKLPVLKEKDEEDPKSKQVLLPKETPFVQILDPATGTATFLVEVIDVIYRTMMAKWKKEELNEKERLTAWNDYVPEHLLTRLHGYELMMAPYAIAHMKIGLKLSETGYQFGSDERARIYLTNTLEPPQDFPDRFAFEVPALAHEAQAVNAIKRSQRFTVVIGNPPYAGISSNMSESSQRIVDAYKIVDGGALNERKLWLQDDYVKFIRKAQTTIENTSAGVLGYITNHGYLDNPTFRGMRQSLMGTFPQIRVLDLHGNANKKEQSPDGSEDKNVFDIRQGVAICLASRSSAKPIVVHADLWGTREAKYAWLRSHAVGNTNFYDLVPDSPYYFFELQNTDCRAEYDKGWKINDAMPSNCAGFITARDHFVLDFDKDALLARIANFSNPKMSDAEIRKTYFVGCGSDKYPDGDTRGWKVPAARKRVASDKKWRERVRTCLYRPFDERQVYWADWMVDWPRPEVMRHLFAVKALALATSRSVEIGNFEHVLCTRLPLGHHTVSLKEVNYMFPLYLLPDDGMEQGLLGLRSEREPNFSPAFIKALAASLGVPQKGVYGLPEGLTPEDIFHYAYAVLYSPGYRNRFAEFLKIDFPRLPLTSSLDLFRALAKLGGELVALHVMESSKLDRYITKWEGGKKPEVEKVSWSEDTVWVDKDQSIGFKGVPEVVWNFHIGGYQVCEKWLKDRKGRKLSKDDIDHYQKIVVALSETIRIMSEIDKVIDAHGGWPGAFSEKKRPG